MVWPTRVVEKNYASRVSLCFNMLIISNYLNWHSVGFSHV